METLEIKCERKIHADRKSVLNRQEYHCRKMCDGYNQECSKYVPVMIETKLPKQVEDRLVLAGGNYNA